MITLAKAQARTIAALPLIFACLFQCIVLATHLPPAEGAGARLLAAGVGLFLLCAPFILAGALLCLRNPLLSLGVTLPSLVVYGWAYKVDAADAGGGAGMALVVAWVLAFLVSLLALPVWALVCRYTVSLRD